MARCRYRSAIASAIVGSMRIALTTGVPSGFHLFALLVPTVVFILGVGTQIRSGDARGEDIWLVLGMNRLRRAYLELAPELEPYSMTGHYDDMIGVAQTSMAGVIHADARRGRVTHGRILPVPRWWSASSTPRWPACSPPSSPRPSRGQSGSRTRSCWPPSLFGRSLASSDRGDLASLARYRTSHDGRAACVTGPASARANPGQRRGSGLTG